MHLFHRAAAFAVIGMLAQSLSSNAQDAVAPMAAGQSPAAAPMAAGQSSAGAAIGQILAGNGPALSVKVKELGPDWRVFTLLPPGSSGSAAQYGGSGLAAEGEYYTRGQSVVVGKDTYLIAYHTRKPSSVGNPFVSMFMPEAVTRDATLYLSLINLSRNGGLADIRQFDIKSVPEHQELAAIPLLSQGMSVTATVDESSKR
jgi:hypothetical protein